MRCSSTSTYYIDLLYNKITEMADGSKLNGNLPSCHFQSCETVLGLPALNAALDTGAIAEDK